jgi:hypothetical protein
MLTNIAFIQEQQLLAKIIEVDQYNHLATQQTNLGSMLWSQFSAIFANFWQKIGVFLKNQCHDSNFT